MRTEPEIEGFMLNSILHLPLPGTTLRMAVWQQLAALKEAGYVIVPREPTPAMVMAVDGQMTEAKGWSSWSTQDVYRAMIAASPDKGEVG